MNIESLRKLCLALPHVTEDVKWEHDLCFCVATKMFCVTGLDPSHEGASFKVKDDEFEEMTSRLNIIPAPYVARFKWVMVENWDALTKEEWEHFVCQSYELVFQKLPASLRKSLR